MGIPEAEFEETSPDSPVLIISRLPNPVAGTEQEILVLPGTLAFQAYEKPTALEKFTCSYGLNQRYAETLLGEVLQVSGTDRQGQARMVELSGHPFFLATLFLPQSTSTPDFHHPILLKFLEAARDFSKRPRRGRIGQPFPAHT